MHINIEEIQTLLDRAVEAREFSYSPYSDYMVGAALLAQSGEIITGCNVENAAYGPSNCAERTAFLLRLARAYGTFGQLPLQAEKEMGKGILLIPVEYAGR